MIRLFSLEQILQPAAVHALLLGGHVRVDPEDNLYYTPGEPATNVALTERVAAQQAAAAQ